MEPKPARGAGERLECSLGTAQDPGRFLASWEKNTDITFQLFFRFWSLTGMGEGWSQTTFCINLWAPGRHLAFHYVLHLPALYLFGF